MEACIRPVFFHSRWHAFLFLISVKLKTKFMKRAIVVAMALLGVLVNAVFAQKPGVVISSEPGWHKIGEITASFNMQDESIFVLGADEFKSIKLRVTDAPINIESMHIVYEDGGIQDVDLKDELAAGSETRVIELDGSDRDLSKVSFTYRTLPNYKGDKAHVELYGFKEDRDGNSDAYRDDRDDNDTRLENEAEETGREIKEEARETDAEIDEEAREAKREYREEKRELEEEAREEKREMKEEARETEREAGRVEENAEDGADNLGDDISEAAGNVGAEIKDKPYVDKVGPNGERIYMDKHSKYYYINNEGEKVFITKAQMKDNPKRD
jgi:hypothetical protein